MKLTRILAEGTVMPNWYAGVRPRIDYYGWEVAPIGVHWILKFYYWIVRRSHRELTEQELRTKETIRQMLEDRGHRKYLEGHQDGFREGEKHAVRIMKLIQSDSPAPQAKEGAE